MDLRLRYKAFQKTPNFRVLLHLGFWIFYLSWPAYLTYTYAHWTARSVGVLMLENLFFVGFYYGLTYFIIARFFNTRKWPLFILSTLLWFLIFFYICFYLSNWYAAHCTDEAALPAFRQSVARKPWNMAWFGQIAFVTAIPLFLKSMRQFYTLQERHLELQKANADLELNFLKSQINPHFLFNTLNNIYSLALRKSDRAPDMILKLSDLMRYMLYECNVEKIELKKDIQFMQDYIDLEKIRHAENVDIYFTVEGDMNNKKIPPLLLIPFVENAFKHGVNAQWGKTWVKIDIKIQGDDLHFTIENNKPVTSETSQRNSGGIGIENARKRLQLLYPGKHNLKIISENQVYTVELNVDPL